MPTDETLLIFKMTAFLLREAGEYGQYINQHAGEGKWSYKVLLHELRFCESCNSKEKVKNVLGLQHVMQGCQTLLVAVFLQKKKKKEKFNMQDSPSNAFN